MAVAEVERERVLPYWADQGEWQRMLGNVLVEAEKEHEAHEPNLVIFWHGDPDDWPAGYSWSHEIVHSEILSSELDPLKQRCLEWMPSAQARP